MAEILKASEGSPIRSGFFNRDAFKKKSRMIKVLESGVAGLYYNVDLESQEGRTLLDSLTPGTELMLLRDTDNEHDRWAISVYTMDKTKIGYMTRYKNETIARLMDEGKVFHAYVDEKRQIPDDPVTYRRTIAPTEGFEVCFSVYMED